MAHIHQLPAVRETSTTTGTGTFTLDGAATGFSAFSGRLSNAELVRYEIRLRNGSEYEFGTGTYSSNTLARTHVEFSSNSDAAVNFSAGLKDVFISPWPIEQPDNLLLNGDFSQWYRQATSATATADDDYFAPKWYSLIQGANSTVEQTSGLTGSQPSTACKLIAGGATNRFGIAQIVEARQLEALRGQDVTFQCLVRPNLNAGSGTMGVGIAMLDWTGTADSVTSELVNDWTSGSYAGGGFFAGTNIASIEHSQIEVTHNTWTTLSITDVVSTSANNMAVLIWTEDAPAHANDYLEITQAGVYPGRSRQNWRPRHNERQLCERFCQRIEPVTGFGTFIEGVYKHTSTRLRCQHWFPTQMRTTPTLVSPTITYNNSGPSSATEMAARNVVGAAYFQITGALTFSMLFGSPQHAYLGADAGTSFNGTTGNLGYFEIGTGGTTFIGFDAEL